MSTRSSHGNYADPIDLIWLSVAKTLGFHVHRSDEAYASFDGKSQLTICTQAEFDPDDCLAQMILHELCHALVGGKKATETRDWGLVSDDGEDLNKEYATHRLQAHLSDRFGLREMLAVTTQWREHYDDLGADPLKGHEPSAVMAQRGLENARAWGWEEPIHRALEATANVASIIHPFVEEGSLWQASRPLHPTGFPLAGDKTCGDCAWGERGPLDSHVLCQQTHGGTTEPMSVRKLSPSCVRFEKKFDEHECAHCGACCREGFDVVPVEADEELLKKRPDLVVRDGEFLFVPRPSGRCSGLDTSSNDRWRCGVYEIRPDACKDLKIGSIGCLQARQRVALSRG